MVALFQQGDCVMYGIHGVCRIVGFEHQKVDKKQVEYYVLEPIDQQSAKFYVPTQNQAAVAKLRPLITQQSLNDLLQSDDVRADAWIEDENLRKQRYKELITSNDRAALICMVHTLHKHKEEQLAMGRKFHLCDENFLRDAEKILNAEFSLILNLSHDEAGEYIKNQMSDK